MSRAHPPREVEITIRACGLEDLDICLGVRRRVFVIEQGVSEALEVDGRDAECHHLLALSTRAEELARASTLSRGTQASEGVPKSHPIPEELFGARPVPVGTARLRPLGPDTAKVERVCVDSEHRGRGVGASLMRAVEDLARDLGVRRLMLSAQASAIPFYLQLGYTLEGEAFMEAGIPHRRMAKSILPEGTGNGPDEERR